MSDEVVQPGVTEFLSHVKVALQDLRSVGERRVGEYCYKRENGEGLLLMRLVKRQVSGRCRMAVSVRPELPRKLLSVLVLLNSVRSSLF